MLFTHIHILCLPYSAIKMNASEGIPLSLGELTGGGMFVQSVVVGRIVFLGSSLHSGGRSNNSEEVLGVSCRGELIRDISMYAISAGYVYWLCTRGAIFYHHVITMLLLYCAYVLAVLWTEVRRYYSNPVLENNIQEENSRVNKNEGDDNEAKGEEEDQLSLLDLTTNGTPSYDEEDQTLELSPRHRQVSLQNQSRDPPGVKAAARVLRLMQKQKLRQQQRLLKKRKSLIVDNGDDLQGHSSLSAYHGEDIDNRTWSVELFKDSIYELGRQFNNALISDILLNAQLSRFEWWCMILESPFIILRKLVIPIPCEDEYNRSLVAYSIAFSPVWIGFYLSTKMEDFDPFCICDLDDEDTGYCFPSILWPCCISLVIGCAVIKYAPATQLPLHFSLPIALYGFLIAATWIDVISDQLVNVLEFIGVVLRIPSTVMGYVCECVFNHSTSRLLFSSFYT